MNRPRLTDKVIRGLRVLSQNAPVVDYLSGSADLADIAGFATKADLNDAGAAKEWIAKIGAWKDASKPTRPTAK